MVKNFDKFLGNQFNKLGNTTGQLGRKSTSFGTLPSFIQDVIEIWDCRKKVTKQNEGSVFVVGHETYSEIGPDTLSGAMPIGPNTTTRSLVSVTNSHNLFPEYFENDRFVDETNSTGSWYETDTYYLLTGGDIFQTEYIAYEDKIYKNVKLTVNSEYITTGSNANSNLELKAVINGSDFNLENNTNTSINNFSTDGLKIKITNVGLDDIKINNFKVKYTDDT